LNLNSLFIPRDVRSAAPATVAKFATAASRHSALIIFEAIH